VLYQDATMGELKVAFGAPGAAGGSHTWSVKSVAQTGRFAGFFPQYVPNENSLTNFWRATDRTQLTMNGDVAFVSAP